MKYPYLVSTPKLLTLRYLLFVLCNGWVVGNALAQEGKQREIPDEISTLREETTNAKRYNRSEAERIARQTGLFTQKIQKDGRIIAVQGLDENGQPIYVATHAVRSSKAPLSSANPGVITRTNALQSGGSLGLNLSGSSPSVSDKLAIWDGGSVRLSHQEFTPIQRLSTQDGLAGSPSNHSTHLASILVGEGQNPQARGMAFGAKLRVFDFANDFNEMTLENNKLLVSNHSYGPLAGWVLNTDRPGKDEEKWEWWGDDAMNTREDYRFGFYDAKARDLDRLSYLSPNYLIVKSADNKRGETGPPSGKPYFLRNTLTTSTMTRARNDGFDTLPMEANAKNVLTVGAVAGAENAPLSAGQITMTWFSGFGPTDDGRIKPDIVGVGTDVLAADAGSDNSYSSQTGTSVATPNVAGSLLLLQELFAQRNGGRVMRAASLKGLVLHTADDGGIPGPDYQFGWGLLNAQRAGELLINTENRHYFGETDLSQGETYTMRVTAGNQPLKITISWTDPAANSTPQRPSYINSRIPKLVNDLDLRVKDGTREDLPWTLNPLRPSERAVSGDNIRDNIEQVLIENPTPGRTYTITVTHKKTLTSGSQAFSVFVSGIKPAGCDLALNLQQTAPQTICAGGSIQLNTTANGDASYQWLRNGTEISGAKSAFFTARQAGTYTVQAKQGTCTKTATVEVRVSALQATTTPAGDLGLCRGGNLTMEATRGQDFVYQWFRGGQRITGATQQNLQVTQPGSYTVQIQDAGCMLTSKPVIINTRELTASVSSPNLTRCDGQPVRLEAASNTKGLSYQWLRDGFVISGANQASYEVNFSGKYSVQLYLGNCQKTSSQVSVVARKVQALVDAVNDKTSICGNESVVLKSNTGTYFTYQWLRDGVRVPSANTSSLRTSQPGSYSVVISQLGCSVSSAPLVVRKVTALANITPQGSTTIAAGGAVLLQANTGQELTYQWLRNNVSLASATGVSYLARQVGSYTVQVNDRGCIARSTAISVQLRTVASSLMAAREVAPLQNSEPGLSLFPNPAESYLQVRFVSDNEENTLPQAEIIGISGGVWAKMILENSEQPKNYEQRVDVSQLPAGSYLLRVNHSSGSQHKLFIKQ